MSFFQRDPRQQMLLGSGERVSGAEVREQNVQAAVSIANIVKTSLGPHGLDKMMVDDIGVSFPLLVSLPFRMRSCRFTSKIEVSDQYAPTRRMLLFRMTEQQFFNLSK
jgi:hypothetical protein